jgi:hypothetical protein
MTWARLDDGCNSNAKLTVLTDAAFRLWVCGLVYAQKELSDGFIPESILKTFSVKRGIKGAVVELTTSLIRGKQPLWHQVDGGYQVHDFLYWNERRDDVLAAREKNRLRMNLLRGGTNGARARGVQTHNERTTDARAGAVHSSTTTTTTRSTTTEDPTPKPPRAKSARVTDYPALFEAFWKAYPNRVSKGDAHRAWAKLEPDGALVGRIMSALEWQTLSPQWVKDSGRFIPHPATWLNSRRWEDEPVQANAGADNDAMWDSAMQRVEAMKR